MTHEEVRAAIEKLMVEKGTKVGRIYTLECSIKDILGALNLKNTEERQRYIRHVIKSGYEKAVLLPGQGDNGGFVQIKLRSA